MKEICTVSRRIGTGQDSTPRRRMHKFTITLTVSAYQVGALFAVSFSLHLNTFL